MRCFQVQVESEARAGRNLTPCDLTPVSFRTIHGSLEHVRYLEAEPGEGLDRGLPDKFFPASCIVIVPKPCTCFPYLPTGLTQTSEGRTWGENSVLDTIRFPISSRSSPRRKQDRDSKGLSGQKDLP
jgi:hypothetical protein